MSQHGIKETKDALEFLLALHKGYQSAMADGKISLMDFPSIVKPLIKLGPAMEGVKMLPKELSELEDSELEELKELFKSEFDLEDDALEVKIEEGFGILLGLGKFLGEVVKKDA